MRVELVASIVALLAGLSAPVHAQPSTTPVKTMKVTVLSTMLAGNPGEGVGEWGFAALLEADGQRWLIDTGARAETVLRNAAELNVDLSTVTDLVITHNHSDHTGGLIALRRELSKRNSKALSRAHVAQGIFLSRAGFGRARGQRLAANQGPVPRHSGAPSSNTPARCGLHQASG